MNVKVSQNINLECDKYMFNEKRSLNMSKHGCDKCLFNKLRY